jgi:tRNA(adenine34) deaminase
MNINFFMDKAFDEANKALLLNEVPVGAVLIDNKTQEIIETAHNLVNFNHNATAHAEMVLINRSVLKRKGKFLKNTSIFITLEPCAMCAAAISEMHIERIYFGAYDEKKGSLDSIMNIYNKKNYFTPEVYGGINEKKCSSLLKKFFQKIRNK